VISAVRACAYCGELVRQEPGDEFYTADPVHEPTAGPVYLCTAVCLDAWLAREGLAPVLN
jgi:hypothetical protein